jgi:peptidoglycan/LPS O-acetylase OafA/YrhL
LYKREIYLDFVRGVAILLALGWHFNGTNTGLLPVDLILLPGRSIGWIGVDIFFVLSGFLIGGLMFEEFQKTGNFNAGRFLIRRAFKIWPILYVYLFILLISGRYTWDTFLFQNLFHVQNYFITPISHLWSLAVEEHFYLLFSFGLFALMRTKSKKIRILEYVLPIVLLFCPLLRLTAYNNFVSPELIQIQTHFRIDALAFGVYLAYYSTYYKDKFEWLSQKKPTLLLLLIICCLFLIHNWGNSYVIIIAGYSISYIAGGALLLFCHQNKFITNKNFIVSIVAWIGIYSYAMYVYQFVMFRLFEALFNKLSIVNIPPILVVSIKYLGAIFLAFVITKTIEKPVLRLREKLYPSLYK